MRRGWNKGELASGEGKSKNRFFSDGREEATVIDNFCPENQSIDE